MRFRNRSDAGRRLAGRLEHLRGKDAVRAQIAALADAGVTDFVAGEYTAGADGARTRAFLRTLLT